MFPCVSLLLISFPELQLNFRISRHIQGMAFCFFLCCQGNWNLTETEKPVMERGLWLDSASQDMLLAKLPSVLRVLRQKLPDGRKTGKKKVFQVRFLGKRLWDRDLHTGDFWGNFLKIKTWRRWQKLEPAEGGVQQLPSQPWPRGSLVLRWHFIVVLL